MLVALIPFYVRRPHFFANPLVDVVRALCVVAAVLLICYIARVVADQRHRGELQAGQLDRFVGLGLLLFSVAYTEIVVQGTPLTWRLPVNLAAVAVSFRGIYRMRRAQKRHRR